MPQFFGSNLRKGASMDGLRVKQWTDISTGARSTFISVSLRVHAGSTCSRMLRVL